MDQQGNAKVLPAVMWDMSNTGRRGTSKLDSNLPDDCRKCLHAAAVRPSDDHVVVDNARQFCVHLPLLVSLI